MTARFVAPGSPRNRGLDSKRIRTGAGNNRERERSIQLVSITQNAGFVGTASIVADVSDGAESTLGSFQFT